MKISAGKIIVYGLLVMLTTCAVFVGYTLWQTQLWKDEVGGLAGYQGATRAKEDFKAGKLRLFFVDDEHSGGSAQIHTNDGPFKMEAFSAGFDYPSRYAAIRLVKAYNKRMRAMYEHPDRWILTNADGRVQWK